jgi:hypothetical protein
MCKVVGGVGFASPSHFTNVFRSKVEITPNAFRKLQQRYLTKGKIKYAGAPGDRQGTIAAEAMGVTERTLRRLIVRYRVSSHARPCGASELEPLRLDRFPSPSSGRSGALHPADGEVHGVDARELEAGGRGDHSTVGVG